MTRVRVAMHVRTLRHVDACGKTPLDDGRGDAYVPDRKHVKEIEMNKLTLAAAFAAVTALSTTIACNDQNQNPKPPPAPTTPVPTATAPTTATGAPATGATVGNTNPDGANTPPPTATGAATSGTPPPAGGAKQDPAVEAETIFTQRCSVCHGMSGKGDGPGSAALNPKPRNYTDVAWQTSVTDDQIAKTIVEGGAAVGKSPLMAPNADLKDKPDVVKALVAKVRSFKGK